MYSRKLITLDEFTIQELRNFPQATGELSGLLRSIGLAGKRINAEVNRAGLVDILGAAGAENVQGEEVQKLDDFANKTLLELLNHSLYCAAACSEENEHVILFDDPISNNSKYVVVMDPLDGSSNIDVNVSIGTVFGVFKRISPLGTAAVIDDFLQPGKMLIAAGYILYGSSTMLVYATRRGVNGFTLDPSVGEFCLSHPNIQCPADGKYYSVNYGGYKTFHKGVQQYLDACEERGSQPKGAYKLRYTGSMVADIHRTLLKGGIFMYPSSMDAPNGKLRLVYECIPFSFIMRIAGGLTTNGSIPILDIKPNALHERVPFYLGSTNMMEELEQCMKVAGSIA